MITHDSWLIGGPSFCSTIQNVKHHRPSQFDSTQHDEPMGSSSEATTWWARAGLRSHGGSGCGHRSETHPGATGHLWCWQGWGFCLVTLVYFSEKMVGKKGETKISQFFSGFLRHNIYKHPKSSNPHLSVLLISVLQLQIRHVNRSQSFCHQF